MRGQILRIRDIVRSETIYPRNQVNRVVCYKYSQMLKAGANFPPVLVGSFRKKLFLIDGWHRTEALEMNKEEFVQAIVHDGFKSLDEMYIEAVKQNIGHGYQMSSNEITRAILRMKDLKFSIEKISEIVRIPIRDIKPFVIKRVTNSVTGEPIFLKKSVQNIAGTEIEHPEKIESLSGLSQLELVNNIITILKEGWLDTNNKRLMGRVKTLYRYLGGIFTAKKK